MKFKISDKVKLREGATIPETFASSLAGRQAYCGKGEVTDVDGDFCRVAWGPLRLWCRPSDLVFDKNGLERAQEKLK